MPANRQKAMEDCFRCSKHSTQKAEKGGPVLGVGER